MGVQAVTWHLTAKGEASGSKSWGRGRTIRHHVVARVVRLAELPPPALALGYGLHGETV